ncbi:MAG: hypothetical protein ACTSR8_03530 [Promethearchaeota archaeon]
MIEIELDEFEDFYKNQIEEIFYKIKKLIRKQISNIRDLILLDIKRALTHFEEGREGKNIDEKGERSLNLFLDRISKQIDEIRLPENDNINYESINYLINDIKRLFNTINDIARKSLPKIQKEFQPEIKSLNYSTNKLRKKTTMLDQFLRKKYMDVKNAEDLLNKLPKFYSLITNIENAKSDLDKFTEEKEYLEGEKHKLSEEFLKLEKNPLFQELENERDELFQMQLKINNNIGFKKALKKLKFNLEKENIHIPNIDLTFLRDFLKNPIPILLSERQDLPRFSALLVQLRRALEENKLNLKSDTKEKTIEQINEIFDKKVIHDDLEVYKEIKEKMKSIEKKIKQEGLAHQLDNIKNQISLNTVKLEHVQNDLNRKNKDYLRYLTNLKQEREDFQTLVEKVIGEPIKLNITLSI